ncbi:MAG TPA: BON domain-containing protein [Elusimicrobiota bacterium]|nr:BON domain-containing protein [Elusimicrobiota bacterium]
MRGLAQGGSSARPPAPAPSSTAASGQAASQPFGTGSVAPPPAAQALSQTAPGSDNGVFHPFSPPVHRNARNLSPASTANGPTAKPASAASSSDPVISKTFHKLVFNDSSLSSSAQNVRVYESGGKVTIEGKVASQAEKNNLGLKAAAFVGSANVVNNVTVDEAGASSGGSSDPMVTGAIHRVILGDRSLSNLAQNVGVSESGGKITLTGTVQSSDEKANVVAKAAAIMGPGNVVDNLNVQSDQPEPAPAPAPRRRPQAAPVPLEPPPDLPP